MASLTDEQRAVVEHPQGNHALVLAVAGSGKTTTLAHRAGHLLRQGVAARGVVVLMFNALARRQFQQKVRTLKVDEGLVSQIHSFHSYAFGVMRRTNRLTKGMELWIEGKQELQRICVLKAIANLERAGAIGSEEVDPEVAQNAISLWKGSLIPPERAGYHGRLPMPGVYAEYERLRREQYGVTFDDFVPMALDAIEESKNRGDRGAIPRYSHVIVDEYQDVNYGQQRLIERIAGAHAEVMVVGDDDQTIYEWRGARPAFIRHAFPRHFSDRPTQTYTLSRSFRFGPLLAQAAENVIAFNGDRHEKRIIAHSVGKPAHISIMASANAGDHDRELCDEVVKLLAKLEQSGVKDLREHIVVLGRTYAQMDGLEGELLRRRIPYRVEGNQPFFQRREIAVLLNYLRLARRLRTVPDQEALQALLSIANVPNRYLARRYLEKGGRQALSARSNLQHLLAELTDEERSPLSESQRDNVHELLGTLARLGELMDRARPKSAGPTLRWLLDVLDYREYLLKYYGDGEESQGRWNTVESFLAFVDSLKVNPTELITFVDRIDTSGGAPVERQLVLTTMFRTKGLEFDHVIIPNCIEGMMPFRGSNDCPVFDTAGLVEEAAPSDPLDSERRLFYVALTRARETVHIGTHETGRSRDRFGRGAEPAEEGSALVQRSRFLHEMRLEASEQLVGWLGQHTAGGVDDARVRAVTSVVASEGHLRGAALNLIEHYLPAANLNELARRLERLVTRETLQEFVYPEQYRTLDQRLDEFDLSHEFDLDDDDDDLPF